MFGRFAGGARDRRLDAARRQAVKGRVTLLRTGPTARRTVVFGHRGTQISHRWVPFGVAQDRHGAPPARWYRFGARGVRGKGQKRVVEPVNGWERRGRGGVELLPFPALRGRMM